MTDENARDEYPISDAQQVQMLRKLLLYWDGQWFLKTVDAFGLDAAIELNSRVRSAFGRIEMSLLLKAVGKSRADDLPDALQLLNTYARVFMGSGFRAEFASLVENQAQVIVRHCLAYEGAKRAALPRVDQACTACETLWDAWFETLLPGARVTVHYPLRMGKGDDFCRFEIAVAPTPEPGDEA